MAWPVSCCPIATCITVTVSRPGHDGECEQPPIRLVASKRAGIVYLATWQLQCDPDIWRGGIARKASHSCPTVRLPGAILIHITPIQSIHSAGCLLGLTHKDSDYCRAILGQDPRPEFLAAAEAQQHYLWRSYLCLLIETSQCVRACELKVPVPSTSHPMISKPRALLPGDFCSLMQGSPLVSCV